MSDARKIAYFVIGAGAISALVFLADDADPREAFILFAGLVGGYAAGLWEKDT